MDKYQILIDDICTAVLHCYMLISTTYFKISPKHQMTEWVVEGQLLNAGDECMRVSFLASFLDVENLQNVLLDIGRERAVLVGLTYLATPGGKRGMNSDCG